MNGGKCTMVFLLGLLFGSSVVLGSPDEAAEHFVKTLDLTQAVTPGLTLTVESDGGNIAVATWDRNEVRVRATLEMINVDQRNKDLFSEKTELQIVTRSDGYEVVVEVPEGLEIALRRLPRMVRGEVVRTSGVGVLYTPRPEILFDITVPHEMSLKLRTTYGNVRVADVRGEVSVFDDSGEVDLRRCGGSVFVSNSYGKVSVVGSTGRVEIRNDSGEVVVEDAGHEVDVRTSYEPVTIRGVKSTVVVANDSGEVLVENAGGNVDVRTSYETATVRDAAGTVVIENDSGAVRAANIGASLRVTTSYEPVSVSGVNGAAEIVNDSGEVGVENVTGNVRIRSSYEKIEARDIGGTLDIDVDSGPVLVDGVRGDVAIKNSYAYVIVKGTGSSIEITGDSSPVEISDFDGLPDGGRCVVRTTYKRITLELPGNASAVVEARSTEGRVRSEFPMSYLTRDGMEGTLELGEGGFVIRLVTSGDIHIREAN